MPTVTIDGRTVTVATGRTVLQAAQDASITIPTLCYHKDLTPVGSCRLCLVEIEGSAGLAAACMLPVAEGMVVRTETPALAERRRFVLELLLLRYADAGQAAGDRDETEFQHWVRRYGARPPQDALATPRYPVDSDPNPFVRVDLNKCILCTRCVRACAEVQCRSVWGVGYRGDDAKIIAGLGVTRMMRPSLTFRSSPQPTPQ